MCKDCVRENKALGWFREAQRAQRVAGPDLLRAALADAEAIQYGQIASAKDGERPRLCAELDRKINQCLDRALAIDPSCAPALFTRGEMARDTAEAISLFAQAIAACPTMASAHYCKGSALESTEAVEDALVCYEKAMHLDPNDAEAVMGRSRMLARKGLQSEAEALAQRGKELDPSFNNTFRLVKFRWLELSV